ncbi:CoA transferase [Streptomyces bambusae]|uniref:CoA transferase n=1 Tax=Streptomyces bambusae TaxID=1550616 RepID=UPI001CFE3B9B|nr:CoA transferase [Streptomyces bambusae]MCB5167959.1 CoA transferase [Streptomyces bambusae]
MTMENEQVDGATAHAWAALGGDLARAGRVTYRGGSALGGGRLPVRELARATVGVCSLAAAELAEARGGRPAERLTVDEGAVATAFVSERHLRVDGRAPVSFAPLSGFWRTADGWLRTHANYPHHRAALTAALGLPEETPEALRTLLAGRKAAEVQEQVYAAGGLAVAMAAGLGAPQPLVRARADGSRGRPLGPGELPASGVRVLDLTRVIAGPVATRTLGLLGADVLRVDPPGLPEDDDAHADTGFGKRTTRLDLARSEDRAVFESLLAEADVVVSGYRPGTLDRYGLGAQQLLARRPGLVVAQLCAWGWEGPWADRRGFDSLVQAGYGIAALEAGPDGAPGVLPAQALDHGTGYLVAAGVLRALAAGGGRALQYSLAGTASWLTREIVPAGPADAAYDPQDWLAERDSAYGRLQYARTPVAGGPADWSRGPSRWGTDEPVWL